MPYAHARGVSINYQVLGDSGPWVALSPGGRRPLEAVKSIAARVCAAGYRVLIHDRRNCGSSDVVIDGGEPESEQWALDLDALLEQLGAGAVAVGGASSGARLALLLALRRPARVRALVLWRVSGGPFAAARLAEEYYGRYIKVAERGGMPAICETEHFRDRIAARPANRDRLLAMDPAHFIRVMTRWRGSLLETGADPVLGAGEPELRSLRIPCCIFPGNDRTHPRGASFALARLVQNAEVHELFDEDLDTDVAPLEAWESQEVELVRRVVEFLRRVNR